MTAPASRAAGRRIAEARRQRGMSQRELAAALGRSESWVGQVERGVQPVERLGVLRQLAETLGVSVRDLRPEAAEAVEPQDSTIRTNDLDGLRLALTGHPAVDVLLHQPPADAADVDTLSARVDAAWELTHAARHAELTAMLPTLLSDLEHAVRTANSSSAPGLYRLLTRAYQAAAAAFTRQDEPDAAWIAADRAIRAAEQAGSPLDVLAGHFRMAHAFLRVRRPEQAEKVTVAALDALSHAADDSASPQLMSLFGAMHLVAALVAARGGNRSAAHSHLDAAAATAERIGSDRNDFDTEFGPTNVGLHRVSIAADLGDAGEALEAAAHVDPSGLSPERQARFWLDVARAQAQRGDIDAAVSALLTAENHSAELVRDHRVARNTVVLLTRLSGRNPSDDLRALARRVGVDE